MKSVCLAGSFRFLKEMNQAAVVLARSGVTCHWPKGKSLPDPKTLPAEAARAALEDYLGEIDAADSLYVFNKGGYLGRSVLTDIGYAYAKGKAVYSLEAIDDEFIRHLISATVSVEELPQLLSR